MKIRRVISLFLFACMFFVLTAPKSIAVSVVNQPYLDTVDVIVASALVLNANDGGKEALITNNTHLKEIAPLYDIKGNVVAYYASFTPYGYAVINNNKNNPAAIEFGTSDNDTIREILTHNDNAHIIYSGPENIYDASANVCPLNYDSQTASDLYDYYPDLKSNNPLLANALIFGRNRIAQQALPIDTNEDYGLIDVSQLPSEYIVKSNMLKGAATFNWAIMSDYNDIASWHCGATAVTNLALYFGYYGHEKLLQEPRAMWSVTKRKTFEAIHSVYVKDGPQVMIADGAKAYFAHCGYTLNYEAVNGQTRHAAIDVGRPIGILLCGDINKWHWVIGVGYRVFASSGEYIQVVNEWQTSATRYYKPYSGSLFISETAYWIP